MFQSFYSSIKKSGKYIYNALFFCIAVAILYFNFWLFFNTVERPIDSDIRSSVFLHLATAIALCLPYFFVRTRKHVLIYILFAINFYLIANLLYYRTYFTLLPPDCYTMIVNLSGLAASIVSAFHLTDILFLLPTVAFGLVYIFFFRKKIIPVALKVRLMSFSALAIIIISIIGINLYLERNEVSNMLSDENEFKYDVIEGASTYGFMHCWFWQFKTVIEPNTELTPTEKIQIDQWISKHSQCQTFDYPVDSVKRNVILIIVESLESFPIGKKLDEQEITPFLNSLTKQKNCFYAPHIIPQVNIGHSSDTQLIFNTGMLPPHSGAACFKYQHNTYFTLADALREEGYSSHTLLGGNGSFWNQGVMNQTLGYDELLAIEQFRDDESYEFGLTDSTFLAQSADKISRFKAPFLAQLITLSSHDPYILINKRVYFKTPKDCPEELSRYFNAIHYVDKSLGMFIAELQKKNINEHSIIIISGDHDATKQHPKQWEDYAKKQWHTTISQTPLIIINGAVNKTYTKAAGQIDVYPTLIDMLGLKKYGWQGLGQSIFSKNKVAFAVNARFDEFGDSISYSKDQINQIRSAWEISDLMVRKNYFKKD